MHGGKDERCGDGPWNEQTWDAHEVLRGTRHYVAFSEPDMSTKGDFVDTLSRRVDDIDMTRVGNPRAGVAALDHVATKSDIGV
jgi:hypothetical protein